MRFRSLQVPVKPNTSPRRRLVSLPKRVLRLVVHLMEFRLAEGEEAPEVGGELTVSLFEAGQMIDVTGTSKGKGFQGAVKRWNFRTQDTSHGNSLSHRAPGSIGNCQTPGRVFKGKKMAGQMGNVRCTVQSLEVVRVDAERNLLLVKGAVPRCSGRRSDRAFRCESSLRGINR